jgi:hypothetical protein
MLVQQDFRKTLQQLPIQFHHAGSLTSFDPQPEKTLPDDTPLLPMTITRSEPGGH